MSKMKKIWIWIFSAIVALVLLAYGLLCVVSKKPGMSGFEVTNHMLELLMTGKDYVKVGEDRYLYRTGALHQIIEKDYDRCFWPNGEEYSNESTLMLYGLVLKNGEEYNPVGFTVWTHKFHSAYFAPYTEENRIYGDLRYE